MLRFPTTKGIQRTAVMTLFLMMAVTAFAVPAKPGLTRLLTLADGTTVQATLVGDEHGHFWKGVDGKNYQMVAGAATYQEVNSRVVVQKAQQRRAQANHRRTKRMAPRRVGEVGSITGDKKGLIILVNFQDVAFQSGDEANAIFQDIANKRNYSEGNFKGSMYDYFYDQSDGKFRLSFDVVGPVKVSKEQAYYGGNDEGGSDLHPGEMVIEALLLADPYVDFSDYDWDDDGEVEQVYVVYAGKGEADGGGADTIWPHEWTLYSANYYGDGTGPQTLDGVRIDTYACGGELNGQTGVIAGIGTMCHEFSHCLGYPDFYDTGYSGGQGMGYWDLMCSGSYNGGGYQPAGYTSYERWVAGWKTPVELVNTQTVSNMKALQDENSDTYIIYNKGNRNEYFLLENRQRKKWDASLPGKGLLILHVDYDETAWSANAPNDDPDHQRMTWIPADNEYQYTIIQGIKSFSSDGMVNDPYPYGANNSFGRNTTPAARLYHVNSNNTYYLDSSIEDITQNSDGTISLNFVESFIFDEDVLFYEGLTEYTEIGDDNDPMAETSTYLDNSNWALLSNVFAGGTGNAYSNYGCLKLGSGNAAGSMTTGSIPLTGHGILTFYLKQYGSDSGKLEVTVTGATADVTEFTPTSSWTLCTVNLTNGTGDVTIELATTSMRAYVDEITVATPNQLVIRDSDSNSNVISTTAASGKTYDVKLAGRTLYKDGEWNTLCLPFDVVLESSPLKGATAKTLTNAQMNGTHVTLTFGNPDSGTQPVTELVAGTPYIIKWDGDGSNNIVNPIFTGVTIVDVTEARRTISMAGGCVQFIGYFDAFNIDTPANDDIYYMTSGNTLKHTGKPRTLMACRAYFQFSEAAAARDFVLDFGGDGEATGIKTMSDVRSKMSDVWYTLDGRKLDTKPTKKGVYILNGRKVVIK